MYKCTCIWIKKTAAKQALIKKRSLVLTFTVLGTSCMFSFHIAYLVCELISVLVSKNPCTTLFTFLLVIGISDFHYLTLSFCARSYEKLRHGLKTLVA